MMVSITAYWHWRRALKKTMDGIHVTCLIYLGQHQKLMNASLPSPLSLAQQVAQSAGGPESKGQRAYQCHLPCNRVGSSDFKYRPC